MEIIRTIGFGRPGLRWAADAITPVACRGFAVTVAIRSFLIGRDRAYPVPILVLFDSRYFYIGSDFL